MRAYLNTFANAVNDKDALYIALRNLRKRVILHLAARDLSRLADLYEVMVCMTNLAEISIYFSLQCPQNWFIMPNRYGVPVGNISGTNQEILVIAMSKLGGKELGYVSDLDIIFLYDDTHFDASKILCKIS